MRTFKDYYKNYFEKDLQLFVGQIPVDGNMHYKRDEITVQYFHLIPFYKYLDMIENENRAHFVVTLFWNVLIDQVYYSNYREHYGNFNYKYAYPKFIGNCTAPSMMSSDCGKHLHPLRIFEAVNDNVSTGNGKEFHREVFSKDESVIKREKIDCSSSFRESQEIMRLELKDYFLDHEPEIFWKDFWDKCLLETKKIF